MVMRKIVFLILASFIAFCSNASILNDDKIMSFEIGISYSTFNVGQENCLLNIGTSIYNVDFDLSTTIKMASESKYGSGRLTDNEAQIMFYGGYRFPIWISHHPSVKVYIVPMLGFYHSRYVYEDSYYGKNKYAFNEMEFSYGIKTYYNYENYLIGFKATRHLLGISIGVNF